MKGRRALAGRDQELGQLRSVLPGRDVPPALVVVAGEAGLGKTRLLDELARIAVADGVEVLRGGTTAGDPDAMDPWVDVCLDAGLLLSAGDTTIRAAERRWELVAQLRDAVGRLAPVLVAIDDAHLAAPDSLWVVERLISDPALRGLTIALGARPSVEDDGGWTQLLRRALVVRLYPLDEDAITLLLADEGPDAPSAAAVLARSGGNPLLVHELLSLGIDAEITPTVAATVGRRLDVAGQELADLAALLAVAGAATPVSVLAAAAGLSTAVVTDLLAQAAHSGLIRGEASRRSFRHDLLAEVALARLSSSHRAQLDEALAAAWDQVDAPTARRMRAGHLLAAVPRVEPVMAVEVALATAEAVAATDPATSLALARRSVVVADDHLPGDVEVRAHATVVEAEATIALGDVYAGMATAAEAVTLLRLAQSTNALLRARAEIAASRRHDAFTPDAVHRESVGAALDLLGGDSPEHAALLGRFAALTTSFPGEVDAAHELADRAIAMARRLDDPVAIIQALSDRYFCVVDPADADARGAVADEVLHLARACDRPDLSLLGLQWRSGALLARGDLAGATAVLDDLEALAAVRPSPEWRLSGALRRVPLLALAGDPDGALELLAASIDEGRGTMDPIEARGVLLEGHLTVGRLYRRPDPRLVNMAVGMLTAVPNPPPVAFVAVRLAHTRLVTGDLGLAHRVVSTWAPRADDVAHAYLGLLTTAALAELVVATGTSMHAATVCDALTPWSGRLVSDNGIGLDLPVDAHRARLLYLDGRPGEAANAARGAVELADATGAAVLRARTRSVLADLLEANGDDGHALRVAASRFAVSAGAGLPAPGGSLEPMARLDGAVTGRSRPDRGEGRQDGRVTRGANGWVFASPLGTARIPDTRGCLQLASLLAARDRDVAATDLAAASGAAVPAADLGPTLDASAKRAYRERVHDLEETIATAERDADTETASAARAELDAVMAELRRAVGLGGRDRPQGSSSERARVNVTRTLRRAIAAIADVAPDLGSHLAVSVRTGSMCSYAPEPAAAIAWRVEI